MVRVDRYMKNERMLEVLIVIIIIPLISILAGYFISKNIVEPNISKASDGDESKELIVKGIDFFEVVLGSYTDFDSAIYHDDLMKMKKVYSFVSKDMDKYLLIGGMFLDKEQAALFSASLESKGISSEVYVQKGPSIKIIYDKKLTSKMDLLSNRLQDFQQIFEYMSALSYKSFNYKLSKEELKQLEYKVDNLKNNKEDFEKEEVNMLMQKVIDIVDKVTNDIKKIEMSADLEDGNTFSLLQQSLLRSCEEYNTFLKTIATQNQ